MKKNIIISAGGTGGHIFPALAVAYQLSNEYNIIWVGAKAGMENQIVPKHGYKLKTVTIGGIRNKGIGRKLMLPFVLFRATLQCLMIMLRYNPDAIVGFGGYATFPICLVAKLLSKPVIIHEQNSVAGLTNKIIAKMATQVLVAFPGVLPSRKTHLVGNPVRQEIIALTDENKKHIDSDGSRGIRILVVGGSLGAKVLNDIVPLAVAKVMPGLINSIFHQVGRTGNLDLTKEIYVKHSINAKVVTFIDDMAEAYKNADLIICRAGASTVAEAAAAKIAAIFVPFPYAVDDHQTKNAKFLVDNNAAYLIQQSELTPDSLAGILNGLSIKKCQELADKAGQLAILDSTEQICEHIRQVINTNL